MNANIRTIGGAIGAAIVSSVLAATLKASGFPTKAGYSLSFGIMALASIAGLAAAFFVPKPEQDQVDDVRELVHAEIAMVAGATIVD